jgi:ubiquinone/menaquinone biosynthesis C-methylase UbiE
MRVLDIGCGSGDVAMLAADLVGKSGSVVAIDRDPQNLAFASERAAQAGYANTEFRAADILTFSDPQSFDAIVGRYILLFLPYCARALGHLAQMLRRGGVLAMIEPDFSASWRSIPAAPLFDQTLRKVYAVIRGGGINTNVAVELYKSFFEAGFPDARLSCEHWISGALGSWVPHYIAELTESLLPAMEKQGIATREEMQIETLAERLEAEATATRGVYIGYPIISAWAKKP